MTDEEALRAAVLAHPDDDTPRLVYADWCDDAGHADRAAFVRAQIEAARAEPWSPAARVAEARAAVYIAGQNVHGVNASRSYPNRYRFERGFIEDVGGTVGGFPGWFDEVCETDPVRRLRCTESGADPDYLSETERWFSVPQLSRLVALDVSALRLASTTDFEQIEECAHLSNLRELRLASLPVPPDWLRRFLPETQLLSLTTLDLSDIPNLGPALAAGLQAAPHRRFKKLNISGVRFLSNELKRVLGSRALAAVEELRLGWPFPGPGPLTMLQLGWVMPWARLRLLDLAGQQLGPDGVKEITRERDAAGLRWLGLARNHLGTAGAEWLLESPHLNLYHLDVSDNGIPPQLLAALRARFPDAVVVG